MKKGIVFVTSMSFILISMGMVTNKVVAQEDRVEAIKQRIKDYHDIYNPKRMIREELVEAASQGKICVDTYTIDYVEKDTDPHIDKGDQFVLVGPHPISGIWQITPFGESKKWDFAHYQAVPDIDPNLFDLWFVKVKPHVDKDTGATETERDHYYRIEVGRWGVDGCPDYVFFHSVTHWPSSGSLHPGHAGGGR